MATAGEIDWSLCESNILTKTLVLSDKSRYEFCGSTVFATYSQTSILPDEFVGNFLARLDLLDSEAIYYGCAEHHEDGGIHFHVVITFSKRKHCRDLRKALVIEGGSSIHFVKSKPRQNRHSFLLHHEDYVEKEGFFMFGTRQTSRKRTLEELDDVSIDRHETVKRIKAALGYRFVTQCKSITGIPYLEYKYLHKEDRGPRKPLVGHPAITHCWKEIDVIDDWVKMYVRDKSWGGGRPMSLLLVDDSKVGSRSGKTKWAQSLGNHCMLMTDIFQVGEFYRGGDYVIIDNVEQGGRGCDLMMRQIIGCQEEISFTAKNKEAEWLSWNKPCIWLCNEDNDPRCWFGGRRRKYVENTSLVFLLGSVGGKLWDESRPLAASTSMVG
jgi:hypothetical protein